MPLTFPREIGLRRTLCESRNDFDTYITKVNGKASCYTSLYSFERRDERRSWKMDVESVVMDRAWWDFDMLEDGTLEDVKKEDGIAWIKGSHLWNKLFLRTRFNDGHYVDGEAGIVNGKKYELTPNILENKNNYEFLQWDLEVGDCIYFDIRTLHGGLNSVTPKQDVTRYTLRMAKEDSKIIYRGDWAREERAIMEDNGYKNGDDLSGRMFPTLFESN